MGFTSQSGESICLVWRHVEVRRRRNSSLPHSDRANVLMAEGRAGPRPVGVVRLVQGEASLKRVVKAQVVDRLVDRLFDEQRRDGGELGDPWSSRVRPATTLESRRPSARIGLTRPSSIAAYASCSWRRSGSAFSRTRTATRRRLLQRQRRKRGAGFGTPHRHSLDRPLGTTRRMSSRCDGI